MISYTKYAVCLLCTCALFSTTHSKYDPFMDAIWFKMAWPGVMDPSKLPDPITNVKDAASESSSVVMTTKDNEKYKCIIPYVKSNKEEAESVYEGPDEMTLLQPLFQQKSCSYRIETFWTYELCHGQFFHQYHDEKDTVKQKTRRQEYFLGYYEKPEDAKSTNGETLTTVPKKHQVSKPVKKIDGVDMPYFTVNMTKGTVCDLSNQNRRVSVHYICQPQGKGEIYDLKETSTCEYEATVLTFLLCGHPDYQPKKKKVNEIQCHSVNGAPKQPVSLDQLIKDSLTMQDQNKEQQDAESEKEDRQSKRSKNTETESMRDRTTTTISAETDQEMIRTFLSGEYCITGGAGWWKHELCYGKYVKQFHETEDDKRIDIRLGTWNFNAHKDWLLKNPNKLAKPLNKRKHISQYYGSGDTCDLTGKPRQVEVKLTCKENPNQPHAITIYLIEPKTCEYVLVVESQLMCQLIEKADDSSIIVIPPS